MKKYQYWSICLLIALSGCQKLDRDFITTVNRQQVEQSYGNVKNLLTGIYADLPDGTLYIGNAMLASASDEAEFTGETNGVQSFNTGSWNAISNPDYVWDRYYRSIRRANQFLKSTGNINLDQYKLDPSPSSQSVYTSYTAEIKRWGYETRWLRAFYFFELVKRYGGIPIITTSLSLDDNLAGIKRNTLQECISFITSECDSAAANLPLNTSTAPYIVANDLGRATKLSALALKSRVLLYAASDLWNTPSWAGGFANPELISLPTTTSRSDRWKAASDAAKAVIDAAGLPTLSNYKNLFNTFNTAEIIFTRSTAASNTFERNNSPVAYPGITIANSNTPSQDLVDAYDVIVNSTTTAKFDWNNPTYAAAPYANRDPRLAQTVVLNNTTYGTVTTGRPGNTNVVQLFTGGLDAKPVPYASKTGYYLRKYTIESLNLTAGNTAVHSWIIFRYPEIYLNYAEALNEWSPGAADIKTYYDKVRSRAGVPLLPAGLSQSDVREKIRNERRVEFAFEDHRLWDVRRWMTAPAVLGAPLRGVDITKTNTGTFTYAPNVVENRVFEPKMYLYPIPQSELNLTPSLVQNPLW